MYNKLYHVSSVNNICIHRYISLITKKNSDYKTCHSENLQSEKH